MREKHLALFFVQGLFLSRFIYRQDNILKRQSRRTGAVLRRFERYERRLYLRHGMPESLCESVSVSVGTGAGI